MRQRFDVGGTRTRRLSRKGEAPGRAVARLSAQLSAEVVGVDLPAAGRIFYNS